MDFLSWNKDIRHYLKKKNRLRNGKLDTPSPNNTLFT